MNGFVMFLAILGIVFLLIAVHEVGHYLAGLTANIPADHMRVRLLTFPQHVVLRDGDAWCSPVTNMPRYIELSRAYLTTRARAFRYVAGGFAVEACFVVALCAAALAGGWRFLAFWAAMMSLAVMVINIVLMDVPWAILRRHPMGDTSGLWQIAPAPAVAFTAAMLLLRAALVAIVTSAA